MVENSKQKGNSWDKTIIRNSDIAAFCKWYTFNLKTLACVSFKKTIRYPYTIIWYFALRSRTIKIVFLDIITHTKLSFLIVLQKAQCNLHRNINNCHMVPSGINTQFYAMCVAVIFILEWVSFNASCKQRKLVYSPIGNLYLVTL